jgi:hypothetical protein
MKNIYFTEVTSLFIYFFFFGLIALFKVVYALLKYNEIPKCKKNVKKKKFIIQRLSFAL